MAIPAFSSQDLAKLVLGYLAEEQLMTAYDEFLQASPYLDALRNEYDRMCMMSLKNILAEYIAVKISVETCRPFVLRKRLFQCTNLLEVVKFLINYVDINKLQELDANEKPSSEKQNVSVKVNCEVCNSLKLPNCACKRTQGASVSYDSQIEASSSQSSVEATPLADLPGNYGINRKKHVKTLEKDSSSYSNSSVQQGDVNGKDSNSICSGDQNLLPHNISRSDSTMCMNSVKTTDSKESRPKIEEFNDVFESVVKRNSTISESLTVSSHKVPHANTFREFETGVSPTDRHSTNVPDSSTSENLNVQSFTKDFYNENMRVGPQCQLLLQVSNVNDNIEIQTCRGTPTLPALLPKTDEQKIKILSDVKVARKLGDEKKPLQFKNATSTPLMQMQTIVINGTPAYKQNAVNAYTKDEIMAMPTLIVVPPTGSSKNSTKSHVKAKTSVSSKNLAANLGSPSSVLGPLVIDVPNIPGVQKKANAVSDRNMPNIASSNLIKTVDQVKNATVPKDNGATTTVSTNTPQGLPPVRKSSSTPRRTSHVRVLDFTTPRRILHETISEQVISESTENAVEVVLSGSPSITNTFITTNSVESSDRSIITYKNASVQNVECIQIDDEPTTDNVSGNIVIRKGNCDWDADLRALAVAGEVTVQNKPKPKKPKKKKDKLESNKDKSIRKQVTPKGKKSKRRRKFEEDDDEPTPDPNRKPEVPVKPNINIISAYSEETLSKHVTEPVSNKTEEKEDDYTETPEGDRLSLQNVIGAKLNISDLLETPYKQALYDIQMGTPRFLGPDLPGEPMSDIKIMNIPTPRFLNTPKLTQATPGSYSSRPTDYSSGGSYYKPDDQDYILIPDLNIPVAPSKEEKSNTKTEEKECDTKKSRPVRQCTKNVSYISSGAGKSKRIEENTDTSSSCSESGGLNSTNDSKSEKENVLKTPVNNKSRSRVLSESNKKATVKKRQPTSAKDKSKTIIKVKSRQTPTKLTTSGRRKVLDISKFPSPHKLARKLTLSKEKHANVQPLVTFPPTKSRRKSSSPRKLHRTKTSNSSNFRTSSPDTQKSNIPRDTTNSHDSDTEQLALRWSDDGSQDVKAKELSTNISTQENEEISQIKEYIQTTQTTGSSIRDGEGSLQADLIRRGFDVETAKIIERDLLDTPPQADMINRPQVSVEIVEAKVSPHEKTVETDVSSVNNDLQIVQEDDDVDIVELSIHESNEDTVNYFSCQHDYTKEVQQTSPITLRDNFTIEFCVDEDLTVRLKASTFSMTLDQGPVAVDETDLVNAKETEMAVRSISMFTPIKESIKAQCYEIFDSTLTSLDTPLKPSSPRRTESTVTDIVLEEEKTESKEKPDTKKRKRGVPDDSAVDKKKSKHDPQYLFTSTNIQNIDIETVLKKLHGPT